MNDMREPLEAARGGAATRGFDKFGGLGGLGEPDGRTEDRSLDGDLYYATFQSALRRIPALAKRGGFYLPALARGGGAAGDSLFYESEDEEPVASDMFDATDAANAADADGGAPAGHNWLMENLSAGADDSPSLSELCATQSSVGAAGGGVSYARDAGGDSMDEADVEETLD